MKKLGWIAAIIVLASGAFAAEYEIPWYTIDGGGGTSIGGVYSLTGTIGQADTGVSSGGVYVNSAGFWPGNFGCVVNLTDLRLLAEAWMEVGTDPADLDASGKVDLSDFAILSAWWLDHCPADWPLK
ncbi:MAG: hypothetical protein GX455_08405 [Phycisphaerae bacterium]|nr:hypothetical protein [Phycisphaerae bacterium]